MILPPAKDRQTDFQDPAIFLFPFRMTFLWELVAAGEGKKEVLRLPGVGIDRPRLGLFYILFFFFGRVLSAGGWMDRTGGRE